LIHCHGWFTGLIPLYIKKFYSDDPLFMDSQVVTSIYDQGFSKNLDSRLIKKLTWDGIEQEDLEIIAQPSYLNWMKLAINFSDGIIFGSQNIEDNIKKYVIQSGLPSLEYHPEETYIDAYSDFYDKILSEVVNGAN
jgi:starch synthase